MSSNPNKIITLQELINAQVDAYKLELIMNEAPWVEVETRLGRKCYSIATIQGIIDQFQIDTQNVLQDFQDAIAQIVIDHGLDASFVVDGNINQHERNSGIKSITQLRLTKPSKKGDRVFLASVNEDQNEGGGEFIAAQKAGLVDDGGLVIASPDPLLFWVRINYDFVTPEMFGAIAYRYLDGSPNYTSNYIDSYTALQKAIDSGKPVELSLGVYNTSKPLIHTSNLKIKGLGMERSIICKRTNDTASTGDPLYDVDAVMIARGKYVEYVEFDSFQINKAWDDTWLPNYLFHGTGYHAPYLAQSSFKNFRTSGTKYGVYNINLWMTSWIKCSFSASSGMVFGGLLSTEAERGGTTNNFENCWVKHVYDAGAYAWNLTNMFTTTIKNGSTDAIGRSGSVTDELCAAGVFNIDNSIITIDGYGCEVAHMKGYLRATSNAVVTIRNITAYQLYNRYGGSTAYLFDLGDYTRLQFEDSMFLLSYASGEAGLPTPNFMRVGTRGSARISNVMMYPRVPTAINTSTGFDIVATDNAHVVVENDNSRIEYSIGQPSNTPPETPAINTTNRGVQSTTTSHDFGLVNASAGSWNGAKLRLGSAHIYKTANGIPYYSPTTPDGDWVGVPMIGASYSAGVPGNPIPCQLHFNTATKKLMMRTADKWYEVVMTEV